MTKTCKTCKEEKELSYFYLTFNSKDNHSADCKECLKEYHRIRYKNESVRNRKIEKAKELYYKRKVEYFNTLRTKEI